MKNLWTDMATILEPAKLGEAEIRHFVIDEAMAQFSRLREIATRGREQAADPGTYAQLFVKGGLVMSDTQMERDSNEDFVLYARGDVLIAGLGLGMILLPLLAKKSVKSVTVIEKSQDVIQLIEGPIRQAAGPNVSKLTIVCADIFMWEPPRKRWNSIYFDIWPAICGDNLKDMRALHKRFRSKLRPHGWLTSWMFEDLKEGGWG